MCGITGLIDFQKSRSKGALKEDALNMAEIIAHRGPDDHDVWCNQTKGIALAHRRLSIIDLSKLGRQPMKSPSGRYTIIYNGEIYNFLDLKQRLESPFKSTSDTEVMLGGFDEWGIEATLKHLNGMFALAVYDHKEDVIHFAVDRMGKKPLYLAWSDNKQTLYFSSELKSIKSRDDFAGEIDSNALNAYFHYRYIPAPQTIYKNCIKLKPGHILSVPLDNKPSQLAPKPFWSLKNKIKHERTHRDYNTCVEHIDRMIGNAVTRRMISDVPLGAFLSGGIDSSLVVAHMVAQSKDPASVRTFAIGFEDEQRNEAPYAEEIAKHLGTTHTSFYISDSETREVIPKLAGIFDEPFADPSQIPTWHVCRLAREHVTVALSGDGGDESFAGYDRFYMVADFAAKMDKLPTFLKRGMAGLLQALPWDKRAQIVRMLALPLPSRSRSKLSAPRLNHLPALLRTDNHDDLYKQASSWCPADIPLLQNSATPDWPIPPVTINEQIERHMYMDSMHYLPGDIMVKVDRTSMDHSLEVRAPLLDYEVVEAAWKLPLEYKNNKRILKSALSRYVPEYMFERPKKGFGVPLATWLRGPLQSWVEDLLYSDTARDDPYINHQTITILWQQHKSNAEDWSDLLWAILMYISYKK